MRVIGVSLGLVFLLTFFGVCLTQAEVAPTGANDEKLDYKEVTGVVSAVSKQGIAVEYSRTKTGSSEMYLPLGDHVRLERLEGLNQLKPGDTVKVRYEQRYKEDKDGQRVVLGTTATAVALMRPAPKEGALVSKEGASE